MRSLIAGLLVAASLLSYQVGGGSFGGTITDASGARISGARISFENLANGTRSAVASSSEGVYRSPTLTAGLYSIVAEANGFKRTRYGPVQLNVAQVLQISIQLAIGERAEDVTVAAGSAQLLQAETGEVSQTISERLVAQLPLNGRDWKQLVLLTAAATSGSPVEGFPASTFTVNGQRSQGNLFLIDGAPALEQGLRLHFNIVPLEGVQEFTILQNAFSAQYSDVVGGVISVQTKSGANAIRGSAFEFLRNDAFDASNFFVNSTGLPPVVYRFNQFGGALSGPIRRNRTFYFVDYQGTRIREAQPVLVTLPGSAERIGDFSGSNARIYDPLSTGERVPFASNRIPQSRIDAASRLLTAALPMPNQGLAGFNNFAVSRSAPLDGHAFDIKIDHQFSERSRFFTRYSYSRRTQLTPATLPPPLLGSIESAFKQKVPVHNAVIGHTAILRPNLVNELRLSVQRTFQGLVGENYGESTSTAFGIPGVNRSPDTSGLSFIRVNGIFDAGDTLVTPYRVADTGWSANDAVTSIRGRHTLAAGFEAARSRNNSYTAIYPRGFFFFERFMTGSLSDLLAGRSTGDAFASFLLGYPTAILRDELQGTFGLRFWRLGAYVQDDVRLTPSLVVRLGMRYDVLPPYTEVLNRLANFDFQTGTLRQAGERGGSALRDTDYRTFAPRFGLAWSIGKSRSTVLRGGFGLSYLNLLNASGPLNTLAINPPHYASSNITQNPFAPPQLAISQPLPPIELGTDESPKGNLNAIDPRGRNAYSQTWNTGLQHGFRANWMVEAAYLGSSGVRLPLVRNRNAAPPGDGPVELRRPFGPQIGTISEFVGAGHSSYHALSLKSEKRYSAGLALLVSYAFSRSMDTQSTGAFSTAATGREPQDPNNLTAEKGPASSQRRHRFVASGVWELPVGTGRRWGGQLHGPLDWIAGGWQMSAIYTAQSGPPFSVTMSCSDINAEGGNCRPDRLKDGMLPSSQRRVDRWFDITAFRVPGARRYGNSGRNVLSGPGLRQLDAGLSKSFPIRAESMRLRFRVEAFNALNHTNFGLPVSSVDSPAFGSLTSAGMPRQLQLGVRLEF